MAPKKTRRKISKWMSFDPREKGPFAKAVERWNARQQLNKTNTKEGHWSSPIIPDDTASGAIDTGYVPRHTWRLNTCAHSLTAVFDRFPFPHSHQTQMLTHPCHFKSTRYTTASSKLTRGIPAGLIALLVRADNICRSFPSNSVPTATRCRNHQLPAELHMEGKPENTVVPVDLYAPRFTEFCCTY
jgi:hypothetical protein